MKYFPRLAAVLPVLAAISLTGCATPPPAVTTEGPAAAIILASLTQMGGYEAWQKVTSVEADAIVKYYDAEGNAFVNPQHQTMDIGGCAIRATGPSGRGRWDAAVSRSGRCTFAATEDDQQLQQRTCRSLDLIRTRSGATMSLLRCHGPAHLVGTVLFGEESVVQVDTTDADGTAVSYYFLPRTGELRFLAVAARGREPATVTTYSYAMTDSGLTFLRTLKIVASGKNVAIGQQSILEVEFNQVKINRR